MSYFKDIPSPLGTITLASDGVHLTGLWLEGQKYYGYGAGHPEPVDSLPIFEETQTWLDRYFRGEAPDPAELSLRPAGSGFQQRVWQELLAIPYGRVTTYGHIAKALGCRSAQAVGGAVGRNPISIIIPCHRVVGSDGSLIGYAGGLEKKIWLLELEHADLTKKLEFDKGALLC